MRKLHEVAAAFESAIIKAITEVPALKRGKVWCRTCHREQDVNSDDCLRNGWPECHGYTMTIDPPDTW